MIQAVCWDVGGVFTGSPHGALASLASEHGLTHAELSGALFGDLADDADHPWHRLEKGQLSLRDAWPQVQARVDDLGIELSMRDIFRRMGDDAHDRRVVHDTVADLASSGITQAVITNNVKEFADLGEGRGWQRLVPMAHMAVVIDSSAVGMRKPDAEIYHHLLGELGVAADAAVLVDDTPVNLDGAADVGMHTVLVDLDPAPAMERLRRLVLD